MKQLLFVLFILRLPDLFGQNTITANDIIAKIKQEVNCAWNPITVDKIKAGDGNTPVKGIATTFMATLDVLKKANAAGCNFIITHEPTFYSHTDDLAIHAGESIQEEKLKYIKDHNMVVWRFHDHQHRHKPDMIYEGVVKKLGWKKYENKDTITYTIPPKRLKDIVAEIEKKFKAKTMRVVGNPNAVFSKVGMMLGAAGSNAHFWLLKNPNVDLLIVGESNEWETVPYIQDAISLGQNKALLVMGHADSEEAGMIECADWLKKFYPQMNIQFIEAGNPYWRK